MVYAASWKISLHLWKASSPKWYCSCTFKRPFCHCQVDNFCIVWYEIERMDPKVMGHVVPSLKWVPGFNQNITGFCVCGSSTPSTCLQIVVLTEALRMGKAYLYPKYIFIPVKMNHSPFQDRTQSCPLTCHHHLRLSCTWPTHAGLISSFCRELQRKLSVFYL